MSSHNTSYIKKIPIIYYIVYLFIIIWAIVSISDFESLDLYSWKELYDAYPTRFASLREVFDFYSNNSIDFIYQSILYLGAKNNISIYFITAVFVSLYMFFILKNVREIYTQKLGFLVVFLILFTTPITWTVAITRNLAAVMFLYIGFLFYYKKKWLPMIAFFIVAIFTHFSVLLYVAVFLIAILLSNFKQKIDTRTILIVLGGVFFVNLLGSNIVSDLINNFAGSYETRYSAYENMETGFFLRANNINYGDKLPILFAAVLSIYLLIMNTKKGVEFYGLALLTGLFLVFISTTVFLTNRCMLVMPLFWGLNIACIYEDGAVKNINTIQSLAVVSFVIFLLHLYSYRLYYFSFLY